METIRALIAEEMRHAGDLGRFMNLNGIAWNGGRWPGRVFRKLRKVLGTLEPSIGVLLTAEIMAKIYYAALREVTKFNR